MTSTTGAIFGIPFRPPDSEQAILEYLNLCGAKFDLADRHRNQLLREEDAAHLGDLSEAILATVSVVRGELLGEPSAELRGRPVTIAKYSAHGRPSLLIATTI